MLRFFSVLTNENRKTRDLNLDTVVEWGDIVAIYYQVLPYYLNAIFVSLFKDDWKIKST